MVQKAGFENQHGITQGLGTRALQFSGSKGCYTLDFQTATGSLLSDSESKHLNYIAVIQICI